MKFLALILLFGLATASFHDTLDDSDQQDFISRSEKKDKDGLQTELVRKLKETFDHIVKRIKEAVESGKEVEQKWLDKTKDLAKKLKTYGEDVSEEAKDILHYLKSRIENWYKELIDVLGDNSTTAHRADDRVKEIVNDLRERLKSVLQEIKKAIEAGKRVSQDLWDKAKDRAAELKKYGMDVGEEIKDLITYLKSRISEWAKELLDILHGKNEKRSLMDKMKEHIEKSGLLKHIEELKQMLTDGTAIEKVKEFITKQFGKLELVKMFFHKKLDDGKDHFKTLLEVMFPKKNSY